MATPTLPYIPSAASQKAIVQFVEAATSYSNTSWNLREQFLAIDRAYMREENLLKEHQRSKAANAYGDSSKLQNVEIPIVMPAVESAVTYQSSVFLTGEPIFGVISSPQYIDAALQMQTVIADQATRGGWVTELIKNFRDGFKYKISALEVTWDKESVASLQTNTSQNIKEAEVSQVNWEGNKIEKLDIYNTFWDPRVDPVDVPTEAEYAGYVKIYSRSKLKSFLAKLDKAKIIANVLPALESSKQNKFYSPQINPKVTSQKTTEFNWMSWAGVAPPSQEAQINYKDSYEVIKIYARIIPADFGFNVPSKQTPQIWCFILVNNVVIYADRQTNAHNLIPILLSQPSEDGLGLQTKSLAENVHPLQQVSSALWDSVIAARRKAIYDRVIYDPSRISKDQMESPNPIARIPTRPSAYGKPVGDSVYVFPFRDDQSPLVLQEAQQISQLANVITGQNPARQGQFVRGNKTLQEFQTVMGNANGRDQVIALQYEAQLFTPLKHILKLNILQYQGATTIFDKLSKSDIEIDPVMLRQAIMEFKISDGLVPSDKIINGDSWITALQVVGSSPQITGAYNVAPMFSYLMKTKGADLTPFEKSPEQLAYEQALQAWQQVVAPAIQAGTPPENLPPQPTPQQYGYNPSQGAGTLPQQTTVKSQVNNIVNNVSPQQPRVQ